MKVLVACEESQRVAKAFRLKGHEAYSCDIVPTSGENPEWHIWGDVTPILNGNTIFRTQDRKLHMVVKWDMILAFPPCTYLSIVANKWYNVEKYGQQAIERLQKREEAIQFFLTIANANCDRIAIENPMGVMSTRYRKPDQIIQPYMFGEYAQKRTCLWLKNLQPLQPTNIVEPPPKRVFKSGKKMPMWYYEAGHLKTQEERAKARSKTFQGIANAMAEQWGVIK